MTISFIEEKKKQKYLIWIALAVILITLSVLWFGFFKSENIVDFDNNLVLIKEIDIDFNLLNSDTFAKFKVFNKTKVFEGSVGRSNPFLPYYNE